MKKQEIQNTSLKLTIEMTYLSNERSILAYLRTFIVFISTGVAIFNIEKFNRYNIWGYIAIIVAFIILFIGIYRFIKVNKTIIKIVKDQYNPIK